MCSGVNSSFDIFSLYGLVDADVMIGAAKANFMSSMSNCISLYSFCIPVIRELLRTLSMALAYARSTIET